MSDHMWRDKVTVGRRINKQDQDCAQPKAEGNALSLRQLEDVLLEVNDPAKGKYA